jgi:hypothetical protein
VPEKAPSNRPTPEDKPRPRYEIADDGLIDPFAPQR